MHELGILEASMSKYADGHIYHVYNRGAHRHTIFRKPSHYKKCLELLQKYASRYRVGMLAYCLMPNHYHLLVRQEEGGSISRYLQTTFNAFVQYFNVLEGHSGTLFQGPAKSRTIETDADVLQVVRYVHSNPVLAKLAKTAGEWPFSDCSKWISNTDEPFAGRFFRDTWFKDGEAYGEFVAAYQPTKEESETLSKPWHLFEVP